MQWLLKCTKGNNSLKNFSIIKFNYKDRTTFACQCIKIEKWVCAFDFEFIPKHALCIILIFKSIVSGVIYYTACKLDFSYVF